MCCKNGEIIKTYGYLSNGDTWVDKLDSFTGTGIEYDEIGNPLNWRDSMTFSWEYGRRLKGVTKGTDNISYTYDADGLRTSKTVNGTKTDYYWLDGVLQGQKTGNEHIIFLYDENGTAYGMLVDNNGTQSYYYYLFNLQGDVVGIMDSTGSTVVEYTYDAWGQLLSVTGDTALGNKNPIRYRGYYYDTETGFYYLQSRYYDPYVQRFINADGYVSTGQDISGYNMYAYCNNNPVNMIDPMGYNSAIAQFWTSTMWWLCAADTVLPVGDIIYVGVGVVLWGAAIYVGTTTIAPSPSGQTNDKSESKSIPDTDSDEIDVAPAIPDTSPEEGDTYYHITTPDNAAMIIDTGIMVGSEWEAGYVYAFRSKPNKYAINHSGAHTGVVISFKTKTTFIDDTGIIDKKVKKYGPVVSTRSGPIVVWDVEIVG